MAVDGRASAHRLQSLHEALGGRLVFHTLAALAKFIRELIVQGTHTGLAQARERGEHLSGFERQWGTRYPGVVDAWRRAWPQFVPFLDFPPEIRKVIYTTNAIESLNYQLRKITKTRGHFPNDEAAIKLLYLGIRNITGRHIDGRNGQAGTGTYGWKRALNVFAIHFPGRLT